MSLASPALGALPAPKGGLLSEEEELDFDLGDSASVSDGIVGVGVGVGVSSASGSPDNGGFMDLGGGVHGSASTGGHLAAGDVDASFPLEMFFPPVSRTLL